MSILKKIFGMNAKQKRNIHLGRNEPCWCGSGKKYKRCHMETDEPMRTQERKSGCSTKG